MIKKIMAMGICTFAFFSFATAQNAGSKAFNKKNFADNPAGLKEAQKSISEGDAFFELRQFTPAIKPYLKAQKFNPDNDELNYKLGLCFIGSAEKRKALPYFEKAFELNPDIDKQIYYYLGRSNQYEMNWAKAIDFYNQYKRKVVGADAEEGKRIAKFIEECNSGKKLVATPVKAIVMNAGDTINSEFAEYAPLITADESVMLITARKPNTTGGKRDESINDYFEDIYKSENEGGKWKPLVNMGSPVNTPVHDGTVGFSADGTHLFIYRDETGDGDIYECELKGDKWTKPVPLPAVINSKFQEPSACFSPDEKSIYFVSRNPEGNLGGKDIFVSKRKDHNSPWEKATSLGRTINTEYDEDGVYMHPDGKTLFFSSKGFNSMGGYDVFKTTLVNNKWTKPENLGYPINSPGDDVFFVMSANGETAYYVSDMHEGKGEKDIFRVVYIKDKEKKEEAPKTTLIKGVITDGLTKNVIEAQIEIRDNSKNELLSEFKSNSSTGKYLVSLPFGKNYGITVKADGYLFYSDNINIPDTATFQEYVKDIELNKIVVGSKIVLKNIFFDTDKATITADSKGELEKLVAVLKDNGVMKFEISGHTDNVGSDSYNQKLSENRAKAVVDYLVAAGIAAERLTFKGYGETEPIATNDTEDGRHTNRRTEFKIVGN